MPVSPCPHRQEAHELEVVESLHVVLKEARRAVAEEAVDVALGLGLDDGADGVLEQARLSAHVTPVLGLAVEGRHGEGS